MKEALSGQQLGTVVIGGSQAGLAVGYHLRQQGLPFVIRTSNERIGDAWRKRWDCSSVYAGPLQQICQGCRFRGRPSYRGKDEIADYLEVYARALRFACRTAVKVDKLSKVGD